MTHVLTHLVTHLLTHLLTYLLTHLLTHLFNSLALRYCVLFSSYRLLYFDSEACTKRKGAVDLSVAESVDIIKTSKGHGFEVCTPGRAWVFAADAADEQNSWLTTLKTMLGDIQERKKRQQIAEGVTVLKEGWADLKDESGDGDGSWEGHWFSLSSAGELRVFPDAESTEDMLVRSRGP